MANNNYKSNFLAKVIFRIDFDQIKLGQLKAFSEKVGKDFPINEEKKVEEGMINFDFVTKEVKQMINPTTAWVFYNKIRSKKIEIHSNFLFIEYSKYKNSSELLKDINFVATFIKDFGVKTINRLGLRYINEIKLEDNNYLDWSKYINEHLIGSLIFASTNKKKVARAMGQIIFKEESVNINFNYGLWNSNYPNEINEKIFVLDFDEYSKFPFDTDSLLLSEKVGEYNDKIKYLFESVIKDDLRKILRK